MSCLHLVITGTIDAQTINILPSLVITSSVSSHDAGTIDVLSRCNVYCPTFIWPSQGLSWTCVSKLNMAGQWSVSLEIFSHQTDKSSLDKVIIGHQILERHTHGSLLTLVDTVRHITRYNDCRLLCKHLCRRLNDTLDS